jgi:hypothetical protein
MRKEHARIGDGQLTTTDVGVEKLISCKFPESMKSAGRDNGWRNLS